MQAQPDVRYAQPLRDLGPPTASERATIARILIRCGYPPPPPAARYAVPRRRTW